MSDRSKRFLIPLMALWLSACDPGPATQTVIRFAVADDLAVPAGSTVTIELWAHGTRQHEAGQSLGPVTFEAPETQLVVDASGNDGDRRFTVFAELRDPAGARISWLRVRTGFMQDQLSEVRVVFEAGCPDPSDRLAPEAGYDALRSCGSHDTCESTDGSSGCAASCYSPEAFVAQRREEPSAPSPCPDEDCLATERLELGWDNSCVLHDGEAFCWGQTSFSDRDTWWPRPSRVLDDSGIARPDAADPIVDVTVNIHQICVLHESGAVRCGGTDNNGQLGVNISGFTRCCTVSPDPAPPPFSSLISGGGWVGGLTEEGGEIWYTGSHPVRGSVVGESVPPYRRFQDEAGYEAIFAGRNFLVGFQSGTLRWFNRTESPVIRLEEQREIETAGKTLCAIDLGGRLLCWGETTERDDYATEPRDFGDGWQAIALSKYQDSSADRRLHHRCGVREDGTLLCWGLNDEGQLGVDPAETPAVPEGDSVPVDAFADWQDAAVGRVHTCGIRAGGRLYCWGDNSRAQLGVSAEGGPEPQRVCVPAF